MQILDPPTLDRFAAALAEPMQCAERGVAAPFTAPLLLGARLRRRMNAANETPWIEVVVPNPAGREGWFILPWSAAVEALHPSLMDRALIARLASAEAAPAVMPKAEPAAVREAALQAAQGGLGGRAMRRAAQSARGAHERRQAMTQAALEQRGAGFAAAAFLGCGLQGMAAPQPARLACIRAFETSMRGFLPLAPSAEDSGRALALAHHAASIAAAAEVLITANRARLGELAGLAARWPQQGPIWLAEAARADLVMDGWDLLAGLWNLALPEERVATLRRCLALAPPIADEMRAWPGCGTLASMSEGVASVPDARFITAHRAEAVIARWLAPA